LSSGEVLEAVREWLACAAPSEASEEREGEGRPRRLRRFLRPLLSGCSGASTSKFIVERSGSPYQSCARGRNPPTATGRRSIGLLTGYLPSVSVAFIRLGSSSRSLLPLSSVPNPAASGARRYCFNLNISVFLLGGWGHGVVIQQSRPCDNESLEEEKKHEQNSIRRAPYSHY
jgi:hypothetical protein